MLADLETLGPASARRRGAPMIGPDQNAAKLRSARRPPNLGPFPRIKWKLSQNHNFHLLVKQTLDGTHKMWEKIPFLSTMRDYKGLKLRSWKFLSKNKLN
jgi:hypothetical protein